MSLTLSLRIRYSAYPSIPYSCTTGLPAPSPVQAAQDQHSACLQGVLREVTGRTYLPVPPFATSICTPFTAAPLGCTGIVCMNGGQCAGPSYARYCV